MKRIALGVALFAVALSAAAQLPYCPPSLGAAPEEGEQGEWLWFPRWHLFQPPLADPSEPRFFLSYLNYAGNNHARRVGVIGAGATFPLWRKVGDCATNGLQMDISGGGVARFEMESMPYNLVDGDFTIAIPLSWRRDNWAWRARLLHNSAHLGEDLFLQGTPPARVEANYESVDFLLSYDEPSWRVYSGAEYMLRRIPVMKPLGLHAGAEYYGPRNLFWGMGRWIAAIDVKAWEEFSYKPDYSVRAGVSLGGNTLQQQHMQLVLELYDGHENRGMFFDDKVRYIGIGTYFGF